MLNISIIGSGNVGWHLAKAFFAAGHNIVNCYSKNIVNAQNLASQVHAIPVSEIENLSQNIQVIIVAVPDKVTEEIIFQLERFFSKTIIAHTAGAIPLITSLNRNQSGVFYPLQTFSKCTEIQFQRIPILIEGLDSSTQKNLLQLAQNISNNVQIIGSEQREILHLAAVFACNFSNYFYQVASDILQHNQLSFDLLQPLIEQTAQKVKTTPPKQAQTGPAKRNDSITLQKHLEYLEQFPDYKKLYQLISQQIIVSHHAKT